MNEIYKTYKHAAKQAGKMFSSDFQLICAILVIECLECLVSSTTQNSKNNRRCMHFQETNFDVKTREAFAQSKSENNKCFTNSPKLEMN